ncbi:hypothetical protein [Streptomyces sp. AP-93]|uniref:hypothetical protein n=1 Tax=Streptomyces sp. AP-93 TaxID=2929048 RepID=UPI001FAFE0F2|nr:hypothetical protein [Streptomyces sp. AP-93]MCJ0875339.1 hypothetical protein [Streptomyces sp. AP-93]
MSPYPSELLAPLPIKVRPHPAEITEAFIRRLARANHIRPSLLHRICTGAGLSSGRFHLDRLAILAGTSAEILERTLVNDAALLLQVKPSLHGDDDENAKRQRDFRIQRDAQGRGLTIRILAQRHQVSRRVVRRALNAARPHPRELIARQARLTKPVKDLITALLEQGLQKTEIWGHLIDEHDVMIHWPALAYYVRKWELDRDREPLPPIQSVPYSSYLCSPWPLPDRPAGG